jgi:hypothetical protein
MQTVDRALTAWFGEGAAKSVTARVHGIARQGTHEPLDLGFVGTVPHTDLVSGGYGKASAPRIRRHPLEAGPFAAVSRGVWVPEWKLASGRSGRLKLICGGIHSVPPTRRWSESVTWCNS